MMCPVMWCMCMDGSGTKLIDDLVHYRVEPQLEEKQMAVKYISRSGQKRVHGGKDLKCSQHYPRQLLLGTTPY